MSADQQGLTIPSTQYVSFLRSCEDIFESQFLGIMHMSKVGERLVKAILTGVLIVTF